MSTSETGAAAAGRASWTNGRFGLWVSGGVGPDSLIQGPANLNQSGAWTTLYFTNSPALPLWWAKPQTNLPQRFYCLLPGP